MISLVEIKHPSGRKLVEDWLQQRHVVQWWGDPRLRLEQFDETQKEQHALIAWSGNPIGYLRWEIVEQSALDEVGIVGIPEGSADIDIFIGDPTYLNSGHGPMALDFLVDRLAKTTEIPLVGLCTSTHNKRAIRSFETASFKKHTKFEDPTFGECFVMVRWLG